jgi:hypothetical protein
LIFHIATTNANAYDVYLDDISIEQNMSGSIGNATEVTPGLITSYFPLVQNSVKTAGDADYTILDNDKYAYVTVAPTSTARTITMPLAANNIGRAITTLNICALTSNTNTTIARQGSDVFYNGWGLASTSLSIPRSMNTKRLVAVASGIWLVEEAASDHYSFALDGGFSAGTAYFCRIGNMVGVSITGASWSSASTITTTTAIPDAIRPVVTTNTTPIGGYPSLGGSANALTITVNSSGQLQIQTFNAIGNSVNSTSADATLYGFYFIRN